MYRKIDEEFKTMCKGKLTLVKVVRAETCADCAFEYLSCVNSPEILKETGQCSGVARKDKTSVIFKELKHETSN